MAPDAASPALPVLPATPEARAARREALFRESLAERAERWVLGTVWALKPPRHRSLPHLTRTWLADTLSRPAGLPDAASAPEAHDGLCGIVHDLSVPTLLDAYTRGLYPFAHFGPLKWFSPPQRCVLPVKEAHLGKNLRRLMRQGRYRVTFDTDLDGVIKACAGRRDGKWHVTWITPRIMRAFADLYDAGHVHSFEVWNAEGELVGGGYGLALGTVFFTESQFSRERDTSKLGFAVLNWHLARWGFTLNDGKHETPTLIDTGFRSIPRAEFLDHLRHGTGAPGRPGRWTVEADPAEIAGGKPEEKPGKTPVAKAQPAKARQSKNANTTTAAAESV